MLFLLLAIVLTAFAPEACARQRFMEDDWVAWPDLRTYVDFDLGKNTVYIATTEGILRWSRTKETWLDPWFSVPGPLTEAIFLNNPTKVREDPLTQDVWVLLPDGWVVRDTGVDYWEYKSPDGTTMERMERKSRKRVDPDPGLITPYQYILDINDYSLSYRNKEWKYDGGIATDWNKELYAWLGLGVGIIDKYSPTLQLYPQGVGPSPGLVVTDSTIWAAGQLSYDGGWLWKRTRGEKNEKWYFYDPAIAWGLEEGDVQSMQVDKDGTLWIATNHGLMFGDGKRFRLLRKTDGLPSERIKDVQPMKGGAWVATRYGMAFVNKKTAEVIRPDKETEQPFAVGMWSQLAAFGDTLYASGPSFLVKKAKNGPWTEIDVTTTVGAGTDPLALWAEQGFVAIGDKQGIAWGTPNGTWQQAFNHLWNDGYVFSIDFHGGYFWLGTDRGLVKFDPTQGDAIVYTTKEGLPGNKVFEVIGEGDYLWLGTDVALAKFHWNVPGRLD